MDKNELDKSRAEFEGWYSSDDPRCPSVERSGDGYKLMQAHYAWGVWKAAQSAALARAGLAAPTGLTREKQLEAVVRAACDDLTKIHDALGLEEGGTIDADIMVLHIHHLRTARPALAAPAAAEEPSTADWNGLAEYLTKEMGIGNVWAAHYATVIWRKFVMEGLAGAQKEGTSEQDAVNLPRELVQRVYDRMCKAQIFSLASELRAAMSAAPAQDTTKEKANG